MDERHMKITPVLVIVAALVSLYTPSLAQTFNLSADQPGTLAFFGSDTAILFTKEMNESFQGVFLHNYVSSSGGKFPAGFLQASPIPQGWSGTMWTRDGGTFLRELVAWGYYQHACQTAQCLMDFVGTNQDGFIAFPRYFAPGMVHESGTEIDGHAAIIIAMVALWQRLPANDPFRARLYEFLHQPSSPVRGLHFQLQHSPLIPGTGEFAGGNPKDPYCNVVQNNLCALALLSAANMEAAAGDKATAKQWRKDAKTLFHNIEKHLVSADGSWIWCIDPDLKFDPVILNKSVNVGFGGLNGVVCMSADVLGFDPTAWPWQGAMVHGEKTFEDLYAFPLRKELFDKYGEWTQFNLIHQGNQTGPSYGQGYALQTMLLLDKLDMAGHGLNFLANATFHCQDVTFERGRLNPYYFFERLYAPGVKGTAGCGPLNLVNVTEPLKVARLILGVDDTSADEVRIIPRLPPSWTGCRAENWPIRTSHGMVRADISCEQSNGLTQLTLKVIQGGSIPKLGVRLQEPGMRVWCWQTNVVEFTSEIPIKDIRISSRSNHGAGATNTTNSPFSFRFVAISKSAAGLPRKNSSNFFVSSRASTTSRSGKTSTNSPSNFSMRNGDS
jgi:hypothetical protein